MTHISITRHQYHSVLLPSYQHRDPHVKVRRSLERLILNMGTPIPGKTVYIETGPWLLHSSGHQQACDYFHWDIFRVIMSAMASQTTGVSIVYSTVCSGTEQRKHQSSASLAFMNSSHKGLERRKKFPFDDVIMDCWLSSSLLRQVISSRDIV